MSVNKKAPTKDGRTWVFQTRYTNLLGEVKRYTSKRYRTKKDAQDAERLFIQSFTNKLNLSDMTFGDLYSKYVEVQKEKVKQTTMHSYYKRWQYLSDLKNVRLSSFDTPHYELWRKNMSDLKISNEYKNDIQKFLKILLNFATRWHGMDFTSVYNKISKFNDPNAPVKGEMLFFTYEEYKKFIEQEDELIFKCAFDLLYFCGLRRGELLGLRWKNVDFIRKEIRIKDNVVKDWENGGYVVTSPKTKMSVRTIPIRQSLADELMLLREQTKKFFGFKQEWFVLGYDIPMPFTKIGNRKNFLCDKAGLKRIRLHDFRHSCASLLISQGANITLVARYLGHTKIDETLNTYSHFFKSDLDNIVNTLENLD